MQALFKVIRREVRQHLKGLRVGWHLATGGNYHEDGRADVQAEYLDDPQLKLRRIASPLLDVIPEAGARLAMIAQDGVPELAAWFGQVTDEKRGAMSAWLRAHLATHPGHVELGATKGVSIRCGEERITITPEDGVLRIECGASGGKVIIEAPNVELGEGASESVLKGDTFISVLRGVFNTHTHLDPVSGATGQPQVQISETLFNPAKSFKVKVST